MKLRLIDLRFAVVETGKRLAAKLVIVGLVVGGAAGLYSLNALKVAHETGELKITSTEKTKLQKERVLFPKDVLHRIEGVRDTYGEFVPRNTLLNAIQTGSVAGGDNQARDIESLINTQVSDYAFFRLDSKVLAMFRSLAPEPHVVEAASSTAKRAREVLVRRRYVDELKILAAANVQTNRLASYDRILKLSDQDQIVWISPQFLESLKRARVSLPNDIADSLSGVVDKSYSAEEALFNALRMDDVRKRIGDEQADSVQGAILKHARASKTFVGNSEGANKFMNSLLSSGTNLHVIYQALSVLCALVVVFGVLIIVSLALKLFPFGEGKEGKLFDTGAGALASLRPTSEKTAGGASSVLGTAVSTVGLGLLVVTVGIVVSNKIEGNEDRGAVMNGVNGTQWRIERNTPQNNDLAAILEAVIQNNQTLSANFQEDNRRLQELITRLEALGESRVNALAAQMREERVAASDTIRDQLDKEREGVASRAFLERAAAMGQLSREIGRDRAVAKNSLDGLNAILKKSTQDNTLEIQKWLNQSREDRKVVDASISRFSELATDLNFGVASLRKAECEDLELRKKLAQRSLWTRVRFGFNGAPNGFFQTGCPEVVRPAGTSSLSLQK